MKRSDPRPRRIWLRHRLIIAYLLPTLILLAFFGLAVHVAVARSLERELGRRLVAVAQSVAGPFSAGRDGERIERLRADNDLVRANLLRKLDEVRLATGVERIFIFSPGLESRVDTDTRVTFGRIYPELRPDWIEIQQVLAGETAFSILFTGRDGHRHMNGYAPIIVDERVVAVVGVVGSADYFVILDNFTVWLVSWGLLICLLFILISFFIARRITRPISRLVDAARRIGGGHLQEPVPTGGGSRELQVLGESLNEMRTSLAAREEELQTMLAGIAHEVRNPLGGMELFCGLLREEMVEGGQQVAYLERIQAEIEYLGRVVEEFLGYARQTHLELEEVDGRALLEEVVRTAGIDHAAGGGAQGEQAGKAGQLEVTVAVEPEGLQLVVDKGRVRRALLNLVRNGQQALTSGGVGGGNAGAASKGGREPKLSLGVTLKSGTYELSVSDNGPGMGPGVKQKALLPFFTTREKGTGLGLALVRKITREHDGELELESLPDRGTVVKILLPVRPTHSAQMPDSSVPDQSPDHVGQRGRAEESIQ